MQNSVYALLDLCYFCTEMSYSTLYFCTSVCAHFCLYRFRMKKRLNTNEYFSVVKDIFLRFAKCLFLYLWASQGFNFLPLPLEQWGKFRDVFMTARPLEWDYTYFTLRPLTIRALCHIVDKENVFQNKWLFLGLWFLYFLLHSSNCCSIYAFTALEEFK